MSPSAKSSGSKRRHFAGFSGFCCNGPPPVPARAQCTVGAGSARAQRPQSGGGRRDDWGRDSAWMIYRESSVPHGAMPQLTATWKSGTAVQLRARLQRFLVADAPHQFVECRGVLQWAAEQKEVGPKGLESRRGLGGSRQVPQFLVYERKQPGTLLFPPPDGASRDNSVGVCHVECERCWGSGKIREICVISACNDGDP